jgi:hypothetical protein
VAAVQTSGGWPAATASTMSTQAAGGRTRAIQHFTPVSLPRGRLLGQGARHQPPGAHTPAGTKEMQARNYATRKESERKRRELFDDALAKFKQGDLQSSLVDFENVVAMEPRNFLADSGARVTPILQVRRPGPAAACCLLPAAWPPLPHAQALHHRPWGKALASWAACSRCPGPCAWSPARLCLPAPSAAHPLHSLHPHGPLVPAHPPRWPSSTWPAAIAC